MIDLKANKKLIFSINVKNNNNNKEKKREKDKIMRLKVIFLLFRIFPHFYLQINVLYTH